ncbi:serine--tRNA ligase, partial [Candidatus Aerophobetes bacterium]|nr:serine--tRNA ligase [Candidatus Aerophobetes bacterium]
MIDIKLLRERPELFKEGARKKGVKIDIDQALRLDRELRSLRFELDNLRRQRKEVSRKVSFAGKEQDEKTISWARKIKAQVKELESRESKIQAELKEILSFVPLPPAPDVPEGKSEDDNVVVKTWGKIPTFNFPPKDYITLMR